MKIAFLVLLVVIAAIIFALALTLLIRGIILNSEAYSTAVSAIEDSPEVLESTGRIDGYGFMPVGNFSIRNGYGYASWRIKVIGNDRNAVVHIRLTKERMGEWIVGELSVVNTR